MMIDKVRATIKKHQMLQPGDTAVVALSGGADSVALLHIMLALRGELGLADVQAAHFEHGLRGEASLRDANFVRKLCEERNVKLYIEHGNMDAEKKPAGESVEQWARRLRYAFFQRVNIRCGGKIATAHTLSDNAETVLFNAVRGSGPRGLSGIPPCRPPYIRPLIEAERGEIEAYCAGEGLDYVQDLTNMDVSYSRNRIRNNVIPQLKQVHPGTVCALGRMAEDMRQLDDMLYKMADDLLKEAKMKPEDGARRFGYAAEAEMYAVQPLLCAQPPVRLKALAMIAGHSADRAALQKMEQVLQGSLAAVQLPGGFTAKRTQQWLVWLKNQTAGHKRAADVDEWMVPFKTGRLEFSGGFVLQVVVEGITAESDYIPESKKKGLTFMADYDRMLNGVFRTRRPGDRFSPAGRGVTKPLRKWLNEQGVAPVVRDILPMLACDTQIYWVWNAGFAEGLRPGPATKTLLRITQISGPV